MTRESPRSSTTNHYPAIRTSPHHQTPLYLFPPKRSQTLRLAVTQLYTLPITTATLFTLEATTQKTKSQSVDLILFPETYLGGYLDKDDDFNTDNVQVS
jgi:hypothetical protein